MTIDIDHYQDSGPLSNGRGSTTTLIDNIGWMSNSGPEGLTYAVYPIIRPTGNTVFTHSYDYYTFFKLSGTYVAAARPRIEIKGAAWGAIVGEVPPTALDHSTKMFYRLTDTYATPTTTMDAGLIYHNGDTITLFPKLSTTGPNANLSYPQYLTANTTYYTQYLHTKIYVRSHSQYGNIGPLTIKCYIDEYESNDL